MNTSISAEQAAPQNRSNPILPQTNAGSSGRRWISLAEFALGAAIVIGHNVYHVVPNEVPILFLLGLISFRLRDGGWSAMGLRWPTSWRRTVLIALAAAALRILLGTLVIEPITKHFWPPAIAPSGMNEIAGHATVALRWLLLVWTFAACGEEIGYRGYLLNRAAEAGGSSRAAYWAAVIAVSVLFGYGHFYKGPAGIIDSGMAGLILGATYMVSGRSLLACILAHGFIDTVGVTAAFLGWS
ncbi:MAG TPA: CPBP family intramembrane glutamic endopeptidase [Candidatus Acidoferrum sp.]|jgi:CAAX protease family protein|nr:CPBP family intramembrane glutamic endopeptidase [Candidatus Acidoferrum sp.]